MNGAGLRRRHRRGVSGGCLVRARARKHRRRHRRDYREGDLLKLHASTVGMSAGDGENLITGTSRVARTLSDGIGRPNPNGCELGEGVDCGDCSHGVEGENNEDCFLGVTVYLATMRKSSLVIVAVLGACALPPPPPPAAEFLV